ncbi:hypothetical protein ACQEDT_21840 [Agrobacterium pusense]|uniref:hypothetical protein n=1 Tax=Agrobacterium pusense TaxID=648995 RepID=UPI003D0A4266
MKQQLIPIIVGVTGHRDIRHTDADTISVSLTKQFQRIKSCYPSSPIWLLTGLAEGADRVAATAALEIGGIEIAMVLPLPEDDYIQDFSSHSSIQEYASLRDRATRVYPTFEDLKARERADYYRRAGEFIALNSQIVIAVWDGVVEQLTASGTAEILKGGTADVISMCRRGLRSNGTLALPEPTSIIHIMALREQSSVQTVASNSHSVGRVVTSTGRDIAASTRVNLSLAAIERFNKLAGAIDQQRLMPALTSLLGPSKGTSLTATLYAAADYLAAKMQRERRNGIRVVSLSAGLSVLLHQIYSGVSQLTPWLIAHLVVALSAVGLFYFYFSGDRRRDARYLDFRALAEGLRVQFFWKSGGVDENVTDFYFSEDSDELEWLRHALRNVQLVSGNDLARQSLDDIRTRWLLDQMAYFKKNVGPNARKERFGKVASRVCIGAAVTLTVMTAAAQLLGSEELVLQRLMFGSGLMFLMSGAIKAYCGVMAFGELARRYAIMARIFEIAGERLREATGPNSQSTSGRHQEILLAAGKEALAENCTWLRSHRARDIEVNLN